jgi:hypothetical protein
VYADETSMGGVTLRFSHTLEPLASGGTKVTHRLEITGPAADQVGPNMATRTRKEGGMAQDSPTPKSAANQMVQAPGGRLHVIDHPGQDPALVLLHGFPDDSRAYHRLAPLLAPHRAVAVDWLGYGRSDRAAPHRLDGARHQQQLRAVLDALDLGRVVLVGHDAGGRTRSCSPWTSPGGSSGWCCSTPTMGTRWRCGCRR